MSIEEELRQAKIYIDELEERIACSESTDPGGELARAHKLGNRALEESISQKDKIAELEDVNKQLEARVSALRSLDDQRVTEAEHHLAELKKCRDDERERFAAQLKEQSTRVKELEVANTKLMRGVYI